MDKLFNFFGKKKTEPLKNSDARSIENIMPTIKLNPVSEQPKPCVNDKQNEGSAGFEKNLSSTVSDVNSCTPTQNVDQTGQNMSNDIVVVNNNLNAEKRNEGFYYKKYIEQIQKLQLSSPILVEREKMKVNFDCEVMDYLVNDMTLIFREKQNLIDENLVEINKQICETKDLVSLMWDIQNDHSYNYNMDYYRKQKKFMNEVDYLEVIVNTLDAEADSLISLLDVIEKKVKSEI